MERQKVCIIGGGLTGLMTAITLSKLNLQIDLVTGDIDQNIKSNRSTAISQENYNFLKKLKISNFAKKDFWPCSKMKLYTERKTNKFDEIFQIKNDKNPEQKILYMMNNSKIKKKLMSNIKKEKLITIKSQKRVLGIVSSGMLKSLKFNKVDNSKYNLIIICAGADSKLAKKIFQNMIFKRSYGEVAITTTIEHVALKNETVRQIFLPNEIFALLPISNTRTSIVWSVKKTLIKKLKTKKSFFFKSKISNYAKNFLDKIKLISEIDLNNLNLLIRSKYHADRVLLFGDALHIVHPLAGQGFNMVLRDLMTLQKLLKNKINLGLDIGSSDILLEFSNEVKPRNFAYSIGIDFLKNSFSVSNKSFEAFRNLIISSLNKSDFAKDLFYNIANKGFRF